MGEWLLTTCCSQYSKGYITVNRWCIFLQQYHIYMDIGNPKNYLWMRCKTRSLVSQYLMQDTDQSREFWQARHPKCVWFIEILKYKVPSTTIHSIRVPKNLSELGWFRGVIVRIIKMYLRLRSWAQKRVCSVLKFQFLVAVQVPTRHVRPAVQRTRESVDAAPTGSVQTDSQRAEEAAHQRAMAKDSARSILTAHLQRDSLGSNDRHAYFATSDSTDISASTWTPTYNSASFGGSTALRVASSLSAPPHVEGLFTTQSLLPGQTPLRTEKSLTGIAAGPLSPRQYNITPRSDERTILSSAFNSNSKIK